MKSAIFNRIHGGNLVYNTCWEDPRCDREMLRLDAHSKVVMLTSAGCNALDYLLDQPAAIDCVDMNPRQNALLQLKLALFQHSDHETLQHFFGNGQYPQALSVFKEVLAHQLDPFSASYWQKNIGAFRGKGIRKSFYYFGTSGLVAFLLTRLIQTDRTTALRIREMFESEHLDQQSALYYKIEPFLINRLTAKALDSHLVQSLLGVPQAQQEMARKAYPDGMTGYLRASLRKVFTQLPLHDNYFWRVYFFGQYTPHNCPNYLKKENFDPLRAQTAKIHTHTTTLSGFLKENPGRYTHFVLLDHQDWLAAYRRDALEEEWQLILQNSAPGARILLRTAAHDRAFLPEFIQQYGYFDDEATRAAQGGDRVGTYAGTHLLIKN